MNKATTADGLLKAIAEEMKTPQIDAELERRSRRLRRADAPGITKAARVHAMDRLAQGFNIEQMVSEYRSLRTSVALHWREQATTDGDHVDQLIRFDEAMDRALSESIKQYATVLERARDLFTAALGHDLRSPLSSIMSTAEAFLLSTEELPGHHVQGAVRIRNATNRISHMIQDLLDFAQTRLGGHLPISPQQTDLAQVCTSLLDEIRATWPDRDIRLDCEPDLIGWFDADRIGQLLSNLIGNALKHGRQDGTVTVTVQSTDS
jgi:signal transduction histidine kinase